MDEIAKTEMRNYTMAAGFFVIAAQFLLQFTGLFAGIQQLPNDVLDQKESPRSSYC